MPAPERERLEPDDDRRAEHRDREQEVRDDERRVQVRVHGDRAERRLHERADEAATASQRTQRGRPRVNHAPTASASVSDDRHAADHPVPELDVRVVVLLRERLPGLAPGPVLAAEPGAVSRTTAPVEMISQSAKTDATASRRKAVGGELEARAGAAEPRARDVHG